GKLSVMKVLAGTITGEGSKLNSTRGHKERTGHLYLIEGKKTREVKEASVGDIVAMVKLKDTHTGDTFCDENSPILLPELVHDKPCLSYAVTPKSKADEDKVPQGLAKLLEEDPSLEYGRDDETNEFLLSGTGQVHVEVSVEKLKRKYGCEVELKSPRIPYKETIRATVKVQGKYKKQSGGRGQYGDAWLEVGPLPKGEGFLFENAIVGGAIPRQYIPAVEKGVKEAMSGGVVAGYQVVDVRVKLYDGSYHTVDSSEMAFKIAASMGFKKAVTQAKPILTEPIMSMEVTVPEENMGDIMGDINSRRGKVQGMDSRGRSQVIKALVPMAEIINYTNDLNGMTGDRGIFSMEFSHYEEVPSHLIAQIIEASGKGKEKTV
ncbi:MAG: elongation factor G, partial [Thermodesulfobacteriota bacterium]